MQHAPAPTIRGAIPDDLKQYVWQRDRGRCRCRQCGSNIELQFDHLIPLAFGGATTEQNLQILCGPCNRRKGASIVCATCMLIAATPAIGEQSSG